jgi:hypothetical protein
MTTTTIFHEAPAQKVSSSLPIGFGPLSALVKHPKPSGLKPNICSSADVYIHPHTHTLSTGNALNRHFFPNNKLK